MQLDELELHIAPKPFVERAQRFVEEQDFRLRHQGARQRHPLFFPAAQLVNAAFVFVTQANEIERLHRPSSLLVRRPAPNPKPVLDVLADGHVREQRQVLEDGGDVALVGRHASHVPPGEGADLHRGRLLETVDDAQQRGLAASARTKEGQELAGSNGQRNTVERLHGAVPVIDADQLQDRIPLGGAGSWGRPAIRTHTSSACRAGIWPKSATLGDPNLRLPRPSNGTPRSLRERPTTLAVDLRAAPPPKPERSTAARLARRAGAPLALGR